MNIELIEEIQQVNPWFQDKNRPIFDTEGYIERQHDKILLLDDWDRLWTILIGPRQSGKTTLGKFLCKRLLEEKRFNQLVYLNCDHIAIREWLRTSAFLNEARSRFNLDNFILFLDEVQRLENPGVLLKSIADLGLPIKMIASGSSQLEIKSRVQEHLTGRHLECLVLPFNSVELADAMSFNENVVYGCYPQIVKSSQKAILLNQLYSDYIAKDIIEILRVGKPDVIQKLIGLIAHSSGQLVNYEQLATDCRVSIPTVQNYLSILERTYVIMALTPFVGNKRTEITSNPIYYFLDNGFRNQALRNFSDIETRTDAGLLVEGYIFQEILKLKTALFLDFDIHYWRTKAGAEVDLVLYRNDQCILPIEVKHRGFKRPKVTRGMRSFIQAYNPKQAIVMTRDFIDSTDIDGCAISFIPASRVRDLLQIIAHAFAAD